MILCYSIIGPPLLKHSPKDFTVNVNNSAKFRCEGMGNPLPVVSWWTIRSGWPFELFTDGRIIVGNEYLVIFNAQSSDAGVYFCVLNSSVGLTMSELVHLTVWSKLINNYIMLIIII